MNGALLHLINVQYEDEGSYECEALNVKGMDWYRQWLYVEGKGKFLFHLFWSCHPCGLYVLKLDCAWLRARMKVCELCCLLG